MKDSTRLILVTLGILGLSVAWFTFNIKTAEPVKGPVKFYAPKSSERTGEDSLEALAAKATITLLLYDDNSTYAYPGRKMEEGKVFNTTGSALEKYLLDIKHTVPEKDFLVVIKPGKTASYKNTVNALDQMTINDVKRYSLIDVSESEQQITDSLRKG